MDQVMGYEAGADDYITKPFSPYIVETLFYMDLMIPIIEKSKRIMH